MLAALGTAFQPLKPDSPWIMLHEKHAWNVSLFGTVYQDHHCLTEGFNICCLTPPKVLAAPADTPSTLCLTAEFTLVVTGPA